jgi:hypothetical protein
MKIKLFTITMIIGILSVSLESHSLSLVKTYPYSLSKSEYGLLEKASCKKYNSKIEFSNVYTYEMHAKDVAAYVRCIGGSDNEGRASIYIETCDRKNRVWSCESYGKGYKIAVNNRKVDLILNGVPIDLAQTTLLKISNMWFQSQSIDQLIGNSCNVSYAGTTEELEYECGRNSRITVSLFCPTENCPRVLWIN